MDFQIRLCNLEEEAECWQLEKKVWAPFNWEAQGAVGVDYFPELHLVAISEEGDIIGTIDGCPFEWDGDPSSLPERGWTEVVERALLGFESRPDWACALGASIDPDFHSKGVARALLSALKDQALSLGYKGMVAPVRPSWRWRAQDLKIEDYVNLRLRDGRHFDPWVRTHEEVGGEIIGTCSESAVFYASLEDWERWAKMKLPQAGRVNIDGSTGMLEIKDGLGVLAEDSVWLLHQNPNSGQH